MPSFGSKMKSFFKRISGRKGAPPVKKRTNVVKEIRKLKEKKPPFKKVKKGLLKKRAAPRVKAPSRIPKPMPKPVRREAEKPLDILEEIERELTVIRGIETRKGIPMRVEKEIRKVAKEVEKVREEVPEEYLRRDLRRTTRALRDVRTELERVEVEPKVAKRVGSVEKKIDALRKELLRIPSAPTPPAAGAGTTPPAAPTVWAPPGKVMVPKRGAKAVPPAAPPTTPRAAPPIEAPEAPPIEAPEAPPIEAPEAPPIEAPEAPPIEAPEAPPVRAPPTKALPPAPPQRAPAPPPAKAAPAAPPTPPAVPGVPAVPPKRREELEIPGIPYVPPELDKDIKKLTEFLDKRGKISIEKASKELKIPKERLIKKIGEMVTEKKFNIPQRTAVVVEGPVAAKKEEFCFDVLQNDLDKDIPVAICSFDPERDSTYLTKKGSLILAKADTSMNTTSINISKALEKKPRVVYVNVLSRFIHFYNLAEMTRFITHNVQKIRGAGAIALFMLESEMAEPEVISSIESLFDGVITFELRDEKGKVISCYTVRRFKGMDVTTALRKYIPGKRRTYAPKKLEKAPSRLIPKIFRRKPPEEKKKLPAKPAAPPAPEEEAPKKLEEKLGLPKLEEVLKPPEELVLKAPKKRLIEMPIEIKEIPEDEMRQIFVEASTDRFVDYVYSKGKVTLGEVSKDLGMRRPDLEKRARILKDFDIIKMRYAPDNVVVLTANPISQAELKTRMKEFAMQRGKLSKMADRLEAMIDKHESSTGLLEKEFKALDTLIDEKVKELSSVLTQVKSLGETREKIRRELQSIFMEEKEVARLGKEVKEKATYVGEDVSGARESIYGLYDKLKDSHNNLKKFDRRLYQIKADGKALIGETQNLRRLLEVYGKRAGPGLHQPKEVKEYFDFLIKTETKLNELNLRKDLFEAKFEDFKKKMFDLVPEEKM